MPAEFEKCRRNGGRIKTISGPNKYFDVPEGHYRHVCWHNGEPAWGELKKTKEKTKE
jgi:hypothetical protein